MVFLVICNDMKLARFPFNSRVGFFFGVCDWQLDVVEVTMFTPENGTLDFSGHPPKISPLSIGITSILDDYAAHDLHPMPMFCASAVSCVSFIYQGRKYGCGGVRT